MQRIVILSVLCVAVFGTVVTPVSNTCASCAEATGEGVCSYWCVASSTSSAASYCDTAYTDSANSQNSLSCTAYAYPDFVSCGTFSATCTSWTCNGVAKQTYTQTLAAGATCQWSIINDATPLSTSTSLSNIWSVAYNQLLSSLPAGYVNL